MKKENTDILSQSVQYIKSVGPKRAESFRKIGINCIRDLLFYFPTRYLDRTTTLKAVQAYQYVLDGFEGEITVIGRVTDKEHRRFGKKELFKVHMRDAGGYFECVWFQGIKYFSSYFNEGDVFAVSGKPVVSKYGNLQFTHPDFDRITEDESHSFLNTGKIIPFYRVPKELREGAIGDFSLRKIIHHAVENFSGSLEETLPHHIIQAYGLKPVIEAVRDVHYPESKEILTNAYYRFKFEELFYIEMLVALRRNNYKEKLSGNSLAVKTKLVSSFLKSIPFELTNSQLKVLGEIRRDMFESKPMNRLLQGDVGSGKTIVALIAMLIAVDSGYQAALMAPTEILADQHAKNISSMLKTFQMKFGGREIKVSLLIGGQKKSVREKNLKNIELQEADIIIGTHALFEEKVNFKNLGLIVIDEQHRFGVVQRAKLLSKGKTPDTIVMSATPIPRTLSMTVYGDLDLSTINEMPKNRKSVKTYLRGESRLPDIYKFVIDKSNKGDQTFIVYPLVEDSEKLELKAAESYYKSLSDTFLQELRVGLIHGRMPWQEKEEIMLLFAEKKYDVLVSTTVIEVGIDIPDANIIIINDAHRFGLSQLHQLRGRIGRGGRQAYCILVTKDEYARSTNNLKLNLDYAPPALIERYKSSVRLQTMIKHTDGFKIAEIDLKLRGPGDIFGIKQSGFPEFKHANIMEDTDILLKAKLHAFKIIEDDAHLSKTENKIIKDNLIKYYSESLNYAKIA